MTLSSSAARPCPTCGWEWPQTELWHVCLPNGTPDCEVLQTAELAETERSLEQAVVKAATKWRKTNQPDTETHLRLAQAVDALQAYRDAEVPA